jgi:CBS domain-containing protein
MTRGLPVIGADDPLHETLKSMVTGNLKRLPVIGANGRLVGMLSREELLRILAPPTETR